MIGRDAVRAGVGVALCVAGFVLARASPYRETTVIVDADGCRLATDIVDAGNDAAEGSVVLLHGVVANKKIMSYLAQAFAEQNLRVFVPDLPGHGRTPGPFSFARAEACSESLVRQLVARRAIDPARTILAGHSMGGAIAVRVAARVSVAGVIAISPAPMRTARGVPADTLPYTNPPPTPAKTLAISAAWEPFGIRESTRGLITGEAANTGAYMLVPHATHVSVLFDPRVARASQEWTARVLQFAPGAALPSRLPLAGSLAGLLGLFLLAGPFIREAVRKREMKEAAQGETMRADDSQEGAFSLTVRSAGRLCVEIAVASLAVVLLLRLWIPLRFIHVFQGDYLASFLLILGVALLLWHRASAGVLFRSKLSTLLGAAFAALVVHLLIYAWLDLTITEAWLTPARWLRFPAMLAAVLPYHAAEELLLGQVARSAKVRLLLALVFRFIAWSALLVGIFLLHNGQVLLILLAPYFAVFCLLQRMGMGVVRRDTGSPLATALFGAILLTGFSLVIFPIT
jgi:pimeloyl-ACP methyl ester carboxylesterase